MDKSTNSKHTKPGGSSAVTTSIQYHQMEMEQLAMQMACELVLTREVPVAGEKSLCKIERQMSMNHDGLGQLHNELQVTKVRYEPQ